MIFSQLERFVEERGKVARASKETVTDEVRRPSAAWLSVADVASLILRRAFPALDNLRCFVVVAVVLGGFIARLPWTEEGRGARGREAASWESDARSVASPIS